MESQLIRYTTLLEQRRMHRSDMVSSFDRLDELIKSEPIKSDKVSSFDWFHELIKSVEVSSLDCEGFGYRFRGLMLKLNRIKKDKEVRRYDRLNRVIRELNRFSEVDQHHWSMDSFTWILSKPAEVAWIGSIIEMIFERILFEELYAARIEPLEISVDDSEQLVPCTKLLLRSSCHVDEREFDKLSCLSHLVDASLIVPDDHGRMGDILQANLNDSSYHSVILFITDDGSNSKSLRATIRYLFYVHSEFLRNENTYKSLCIVKSTTAQYFLPSLVDEKQRFSMLTTDLARMDLISSHQCLVLCSSHTEIVHPYFRDESLGVQWNTLDSQFRRVFLSLATCQTNRDMDYFMSMVSAVRGQWENSPVVYKSTLVSHYFPSTGEDLKLSRLPIDVIRTGPYDTLNPTDLVFVNPLDEGVLCQRCKQVCDDPMQAPCGNIYCRKHFDGGMSVTCQSEDCTSKHSQTECWVDKFTARTISRLKVYCKMRNYGCPWDQKYLELDAHMKVCLFVTEPCSKCQMMIKRKDMEEHEANCDHGPCPFHLVGCTGRVNLSTRKQHNLENMDLHMELLRAAISTMVTAADLGVSVPPSAGSSAPRPSGAPAGPGAVAGAIGGLRESTGPSAQGAGALASRMPWLQMVEAGIGKLSQFVDGLSGPSSSEAQGAGGEPAVSQERLYHTEQVDRLKNEVKELLDQYRSCKSDMQPLLGQLKEIMMIELPRLEEEANRIVRKAGVALRSRSGQVDDLNKMQTLCNAMERACFDGVGIFKIDNFREKRVQSIAGTLSKLHSDFIYTHWRGYKLRAVVYLDGDGGGRNTHVSIFVMMCKHKFDNLLKWPFTQKITLVLLNQSGTGGHIKQSFVPDPASPSFLQPRNEYNVASGCPRFVEVTRLADPSPFVKNNCIFFKIIVDKTGLHPL